MSCGRLNFKFSAHYHMRRVQILDKNPLARCIRLVYDFLMNTYCLRTTRFPGTRPKLCFVEGWGCYCQRTTRFPGTRPKLCFVEGWGCYCQRTTRFPGTHPKLCFVEGWGSYLPQHFLYFLPLPQGQGSFLPGFFSTRTVFERLNSFTISILFSSVSTPSHCCRLNK